MNFLTLKEDFYKRYETSGKFLHYTSYGALCTLLGHTDIPTAPSLCCTLSMRVEMFARKSGGNYVKIENTTTDKCLQYPFGTSTDLFKGKTKFFAELIHALENSGLKGAEILYNNTIPNFISSKHAFSATLIKSLMQVSDIELTPLETAAICALSDDLTPYLAVLFSKKGYCTLMNSGEPKNLPLPLSGYKILTAHCTEPLSNHSKHIKYAMSEIRRLYPHINSISDLTPEILSTATDVLSFPMLEFDEDGISDDEYDMDGELVMLGDIVISMERAREQAIEFGHSFLREVAFLTAHSMLHLLGYDHVDDKEGEEIMCEKQERVLTSLGITRD